MTAPVLPAAFLFRYRVPVLFDPQQPRVESGAASGSGALALNLSEEHRLFWPRALDENCDEIELRAVWNDQGLGFQLLNRVADLSQPILENLLSNPSLHLWIDTRDTQTIHRASKFCHWFVFGPVRFESRKVEGWGYQRTIPRAREDATQCRPNQLRVSARSLKPGYQLDIWLPAELLHGYDPAATPRLGFYASVQDQTIGTIPFSVENDFPFEADPSLWSTLELVGKK